MRKNFQLGYRDLGNRASTPSHMNTSKFFVKKRVARRDLGNRASPVDRAHIKTPLVLRRLHPGLSFLSSSNIRLFPRRQTEITVKACVNYLFDSYFTVHLKCYYDQIVEYLLFGVDW